MYKKEKFLWTHEGIPIKDGWLEDPVIMKEVDTNLITV